MNPCSFPLFPLNLVLFPGGVLPLRIFEPRYLTMIGDCMKNGSPFGVVLSANESTHRGGGAFHSIGTLAQIEDFDQLEDGYLGVTCRGTERFNVIDHHLQADQLIVAEVEMLQESEVEQELPANILEMTQFMQALCDQEDLKDWASTLRPEWDNGDWLSCRLSELLPLSIESRQALLEMSYSQRLSQLSKVMQENKMI
ncbi:MAG: LON peptidase substrate-binding domain-containing protein [Acidiferrobacterales bacterium]|nr:LON peptidase substrate-binding domain-containing protein [Acidiferrobacterales bacterium]